MTNQHASLLLRLERGMSETSMLEHIEYVHTRLCSSLQQQQHRPLVKLQIFSHFSKAPFEFSQKVTDALIRSLRHCHVDLDFDFFKDTPELSRLLGAFRHDSSCDSRNITIQSIRMVGIGHHPASLWDFIATNNTAAGLKRIHVTIRANEVTVEPLCQALGTNQSLEILSICCYHKDCILDDLLWASIKDHPTMTKLHVVAMDPTMMALVSKLAAGGEEGVGLQLPTRLQDLQLSSFWGGAALSPPSPSVQTDISPMWINFVRTLADQTPHLQRLGLYSMQSLTTHVLDDILCHLSPNLQYLDLQGNYNIQSIFFPRWYQKLQQQQHISCSANSISQLRQVNIGPQWLTHGFQQEQQENNHDDMMEYLLTLFAKHLWLYQLGGDLECLLDKLEASYCDENNSVHYQQDNKKEHLLTLADWNRSGSRQYARQIHCPKQPIPITLWPLMLQRISSGISVPHQRQASVLHMALQESAAHLLEAERST